MYVTIFAFINKNYTYPDFWENILITGDKMRKLILFLSLTLVVSIGIPSIYILHHGVYKKPPPEDEEKITIYIKEEDRIIETTKGQYLREVVAAEMPAAFELEALKAQAVAARTYLKSRMNAYSLSGTPEEHKGADICTDYAHCKAWIPEQKRRDLWGETAQENWAKIDRAVSETAEELVLFNGEVISAAFHSTSSGMTESSKDVWGGERAYLVSVESPGEESAPNFHTQSTVSFDDFKRIILENVENSNKDEEPVAEIKRSKAGGIITAKLFGGEITGTKLRNLFGLKSTNINITINENDVLFDVKGYGHGVGMSQYGANAMAKNGSTYTEILTHYYQGTTVEKR